MVRLVSDPFCLYERIQLLSTKYFRFKTCIIYCALPTYIRYILRFLDSFHSLCGTIMVAPGLNRVHDFPNKYINFILCITENIFYHYYLIIVL